MNKKNKAFTLAETMIAVIIIGIIAFIVIPNFIQSFQKRMLVSQLQRWYGDMSRTVEEYVAMNNRNMEYYSVGASLYYTSLPSCKPSCSYLWRIHPSGASYGCTGCSPLYTSDLIHHYQSSCMNIRL